MIRNTARKQTHCLDCLSSNKINILWCPRTRGERGWGGQNKNVSSVIFGSLSMIHFLDCQGSGDTAVQSHWQGAWHRGNQLISSLSSGETKINTRLSYYHNFINSKLWNTQCKRQWYKTLMTMPWSKYPLAWANHTSSPSAYISHQVLR